MGKSVLAGNGLLQTSPDLPRLKPQGKAAAEMSAHQREHTAEVAAKVKAINDKRHEKEAANAARGSAGAAVGARHVAASADVKALTDEQKKHELHTANIKAKKKAAKMKKYLHNKKIDVAEAHIAENEKKKQAIEQKVSDHNQRIATHNAEVAMKAKRASMIQAAAGCVLGKTSHLPSLPIPNPELLNGHYSSRD